MRGKYFLHPQVVCEQVAGRYFLIAFGSALESLPYLREINETGAFFWKKAGEGYDLSTMAGEAAGIYETSPEEMEEGLLLFFDQLKRAGYVTRDETGK